MTCNGTDIYLWQINSCQVVNQLYFTKSLVNWYHSGKWNGTAVPIYANNYSKLTVLKRKSQSYKVLYNSSFTKWCMRHIMHFFHFGRHHAVQRQTPFLPFSPECGSSQWETLTFPQSRSITEAMRLACRIVCLITSFPAGVWQQKMICSTQGCHIAITKKAHEWVPVYLWL